MFFSNVGLVYVSKIPGESLNHYYLKSGKILEKIKIENNKEFYITPSQADSLYNTANKEAAKLSLGCKYY